MPDHRMVRVCWVDSSIRHDQVDDADLPTPSGLVSVGWLSREADDHVVISRDHSPAADSYSWRSSLAIPRAHIITMEDLRV